MQEVVSERPTTPPRGRATPEEGDRCVRCGKALEGERREPLVGERPLCFWCAYVDPQG